MSLSWHFPLNTWMGFSVSFLVVVLLVLTKHWHGRYSLDPAIGVKKVHSMPTPRVGGIAIIVCALATYAVAQPGRQVIWALDAD